MDFRNEIMDDQLRISNQVINQLKLENEILLRELKRVRLDIKLTGVFKEDSPIVQGIDKAIEKALK